MTYGELREINNKMWEDGHEPCNCSYCDTRGSLRNYLDNHPEAQNLDTEVDERTLIYYDIINP